jgi:SAM-dependent methyltransferase
MSTALLNRPMLESDLETLAGNPWASKIRELVARYRQRGLPVMNGSFAVSNLVEGDSRTLTCHPYRLWEYTSLFLGLDDAARSELLLDVGGAGAPLAFLLAENGYRVMTVDLQPLLVAVAQHVATTLSLPLEARVADVVAGASDLEGKVGAIAFVSVLEHVPAAERRAMFDALFRLLRPGGLLYMTFDYGDFEERDAYVQPGRAAHVSRSIGDVAALADEIEAAGFRFRGNDPRQLPDDVLRLRSAPGRRDVLRRVAALSRPFDETTPWTSVLKYVFKRLLRYSPKTPTRFDRHNFFRMYLEKP